MKKEERRIRDGIKLHTIEAGKFKTNIIAVFLTTELTRINVTKNALIASILSKGSMKMPSEMQINTELEEMYAAEFDAGIDKFADNQILKFYIETVKDEFLPGDNKDVLDQAIEKIMDIVFNPYIKDGEFKQEYLEYSKRAIQRRIEGKADNKAVYAQTRIIEEMFENKAHRLYKLGYAEDLEKITVKDLYSYYKELIDTCKIDIYVSGSVEDVYSKVSDNEHVARLNARTPKFTKLVDEAVEEKEVKTIVEKRDVTQGKLLIGLDIGITDAKSKFATVVYNTILRRKCKFKNVSKRS